MQAVAMGKAVDNSEWVDDKAPKFKPNELPELPGFHVLVQPVSIREKTKGGIILPDKIRDDVSYLTTIGKVLKIGDSAYLDKEKFPNGPWCSVGDYVCYGKLSGQKFVYKGAKLLLIFDDQIIMKVGDPLYLDTTYNLSN
jgi:co-chaperonin GroES (HSP10)